jgi:hypothetical protein
MLEEDINDILDHYTDTPDTLYYCWYLYIGTVDFGGNLDNRSVAFPVLQKIYHDESSVDEWIKKNINVKSDSGMAIYGIETSDCLLDPYRIW